MRWRSFGAMLRVKQPRGVSLGPPLRDTRWKSGQLAALNAARITGLAALRERALAGAPF
jgi:hypothetical protein